MRDLPRLTHSRNQNSYANAPVSLTTSLALQPIASKGMLDLTHDLYCPRSAIKKGPPLSEDIPDKGKEALETSAGPELKDLRFSYIDFNLFGILQDDIREAFSFKRKAPRFYYIVPSQTLYHCTLDGLLLYYLSAKEA